MTATSPQNLRAPSELEPHLKISPSAEGETEAWGGEETSKISKRKPVAEWRLSSRVSQLPVEESIHYAGVFQVF